MAITHPNNLRVSYNGIALIKHFEGLRLDVYADAAGKLTVGYGHLLTPSEQLAYHDGMTAISLDRAEQLLKQDIKTVEIYLNANVRQSLKQHQFDALASFCFNLGVGAYDRSTLRECVNSGFFAQAANELLRWNKVKNPETGRFRVLRGLTRRREAEYRLFLTGGWHD